MQTWKELTAIGDWIDIQEESEHHPVLILKHSTTCPISARAWREWQSYLQNSPSEAVRFVMVKVIESRDVSNKIASDLDVRHQSPQAILMKNKQALWHASHGNITKDALTQALLTEN